MSTQENNIQKTIDSFRRNAGNPVLALRDFRLMVLSSVKSGDTNMLSKEIHLQEKQVGSDKGSKKNAAMGKAGRLIVGQVWPGAKINKNKDGSIKSFKTSGITPDQDALARLADCVERQLDMTGATFRKSIVAPKSDSDTSKDFDAKAWAERAYKAHQSDLEAMIAALQALRTQQSLKKAA